MTIAVNWALKLDVSESNAPSNAPFASASGITATDDQLSSAGALNASTTPAATKDALFQKPMSGGAATIDLTALSGLNSAAVDFSTLKVQIFKFRNPATNANPITVKFGASNPYLLLGASWSIVLNPGDEIMARAPGVAPTVDSTHKNIDISGTGTQALDVGLVAG